MFERILRHARLTGCVGDDRAGGCAWNNGGSGGIEVAVSSDKSDEKVERVVLSPEILETGHEGFHYLLILVCSKFIWILQMKFFCFIPPSLHCWLHVSAEIPKRSVPDCIEKGGDEFSSKWCVF